MTEFSTSEEVDGLLEGPPADALHRGGRHSGREVALQVLYAIDLAAVSEERARQSREERALASDRLFEESDSDPLDEEATRSSERARDVAFDRVMEHFSVPKSAIEFARELVTGVVGNADELDALLGQHARNTLHLLQRLL